MVTVHRRALETDSERPGTVTNTQAYTPKKSTWKMLLTATSPAA